MHNHNLKIKSAGVDHSKNIIEIKNVSFGYDSSEEVLRDINLNIHKGDYIGFVGPNGSGKTTLIKVIVGLLKFDKGSIKIFGEEMKKFKDWHKIGYIPQRLSNFDKNFPVTVADVVLMGRYSERKWGKRITSEDKESAKKALKEVGMWNYRERLIGNLSGGQMQRVFIARALVNNPEIIFLDEPTTGIDERSEKEFYQLLQKLNKEFGITLIVVSHDIEKLTQEVMHMVCINRTLTCHITPEEFIKESQSNNMFGQDIKIIAHHKHD
jgi:zinc transport system ATP-binding protein